MRWLWQLWLPWSSHAIFGINKRFSHIFFWVSFRFRCAIAVGFRSCGIQGTLSLTRSFALSFPLALSHWAKLSFGWVRSWTKLIWFAGLPFRRYAQCKVLFIHRSLHLEEPPLRFRFRFGFGFSFSFRGHSQSRDKRRHFSSGRGRDRGRGRGRGRGGLLASSYYLAN